MAWDRPILTDSGGFQVVSLSDLRAVDDDGVTFRSHLDGSVHRFTPEHSIAVQEALGSDIAVAFDQPVPPGASSREVVADATARTHRWAERSLAAHKRPDQALFGIVQGGLEPDLRAGSTEFIASLPFDGICFGGLAGDETPEQRDAVLDLAVPILDGDPRVRYLMGLGSPADLLEAVHRGIDLFDSVLPARVARTGQVWVPGGRLNLRNSRFQDDPGPIQDGLSVPRLPDVFAGLHRPPLPGERAARLPSRDLSQPHLHPRLHGQDPGRTGRRHLPVESPQPPCACGPDERRRSGGAVGVKPRCVAFHLVAEVPQWALKIGPSAEAKKKPKDKGAPKLRPSWIRLSRRSSSGRTASRGTPQASPKRADRTDGRRRAPLRRRMTTGA